MWGETWAVEGAALLRLGGRSCCRFQLEDYTGSGEKFKAVIHHLNRNHLNRVTHLKRIRT